jgi:hypothetical protein
VVSAFSDKLSVVVPLEVVALSDRTLMVDFLIVLLSFAAVVALFSLRVKRADGWLLLPKAKIETLFGRKK